MKLHPVSLLTLLFYVIQLAAGEPWPQMNGPAGNFTPSPSDVPLLDDLHQARQLWLSDDPDIGYAKGSVSGYLSHLAQWDGHPGSCSGPILADGKIFVSSFRPSGEVWAENIHNLDKIIDPQRKKPITPDQHVRLKQNLRILADDLLVAVDANTGKTVWKAVEVETGLNRYMGKRQGYNVTPAFFNGRVFSLGTTGLLRAYQSADGKKIWETDIGRAHESALAHREKVLNEKMLPGGMGWNSSLTVAGGMLIVPLFDGAQDLGLRGVDPETGETRWEFSKICSRHATPATWTHGDDQYVLTATVSGRLHLIDPTTGTLKWTVEGLGENHFSLTPTAERVFVNVGSKVPRKEGDTRRFARLGAYTISPDKAERAWEMPEEPRFLFQTWMDSCARRMLAVEKERIYFRSYGVEKNKKQLHILDGKTGTVLDSMPIQASPHYYAVGEKLLLIRDAAHRETEFTTMSTAGDKLKQLADFWHPPHQHCTAYEVAMEFPLHQGRLYLRTQDGRIVCYDLARR